MLATFGLGAVLGDGSVIAVAVFLILLRPGALLAWIALASRGILLPLAGMMVMILTPWTAVLLAHAGAMAIWAAMVLVAGMRRRRRCGALPGVASHHPPMLDCARPERE